MKTTLLTVLALLAFAGNSVLCRLALGDGLIDAAGFTSIRLFSGAVVLVLLMQIYGQQNSGFKSWLKPELKNLTGSLWLFSYALSFSYAYLILDTGSGALILFGVVQITLLVAGFISGERPKIIELLGVLLAFFGLVYWLVPHWGSPSVLGFILMVVSGIAWGLYTLVGGGAKNALLDTSKNFVFTLPWVLVLNLIVFKVGAWTTNGVLLAVTSGAITSAMGYAIWYAVLPKLKAIQAGVIQLIVPILAAIGGVIFAAEAISLRLVVASSLVLGGIFLVLWVNWRQQQHQKKHLTT